MLTSTEMDLSNFLPYLLNQAADAQGAAFSPSYKDRYGMLQTEWRILFHLGQYGELTAKQICDRAHIHKTKASRGVSALEDKRFVVREEVAKDRRHALLSLTATGRAAYDDLSLAAAQFDRKLKERLGGDDVQTLKRCLRALMKNP